MLLECNLLTLLARNPYEGDESKSCAEMNLVEIIFVRWNVAPGIVIEM